MVGRNKTIFLSSDYDHICNDRIQTIKTEFALRPYLKLQSPDYGHIFFLFYILLGQFKKDSRIFRTTTSTAAAAAAAILSRFYQNCY